MRETKNKIKINNQNLILANEVKNGVEIAES
jgi:hypothetical protein